MPARVQQREWLLLHSSERASKWAVVVLYLAAYIILEWASFIHVYKGLPSTPWDPGLGVAFALMIRPSGQSITTAIALLLREPFRQGSWR
jgi:hypothetical protein